MSQATIVFFFVLTAFMLYITQRGELPEYLALLIGGGTPTAVPTGGGSASTPPANASTSAAASATSAALKTAQTLGGYLLPAIAGA